MKIAVSGKGGVGKTTISSFLARAFVERGYSVLAIDADPNPNLALNLGLPLEEAERIVPISENSSLIEEKTGAKPQNYGGVFRLSFRVDDIVQRFGTGTPSGANLIVMGAVRAAGQGCMCPANALIRALLRHLLMKPNEVVVVDMEAGVEHFGRGTVEYVDALLVVTDSSLKSLETTRRICKLARDIGIRRIFLVGNRVVDGESNIFQEFSRSIDVPLLCIVPYDEVLHRLDTQEQRREDAFRSLGSFTAVKGICGRLIEFVETKV